MIKVVPTPKPTTREVRLMHEAVKELTEKLYKERLGIDLVFDKGDELALDRFLTPSKFSPFPSIAEVESLLRARFDSDEILPDRPYLWLENLGKYRSGPLDKNGVPKSLVLAQQAEIDAEIAAAIREAEEQRRATAVADRNSILARATMRVAEDLAHRGFETYRPVGAVSHVVAMRKSVATRNAPAMRIVVRASADEVTKSADFYQAVCGPDQDLRTSPVVYHPPLNIE